MKSFLKAGKALALVSLLGLCVPGTGRISCGAEPARKPVARLERAQDLTLDVTLNARGAFEGVVSNPDGQANPLATVSLRSNGTELRRTPVDESGRFSFENVRPGVYLLSAEGETVASRLVRVWPNGSGPPRSTPLACLTLGSVREGDIVRGQFGRSLFGPWIYRDSGEVLGFGLLITGVTAGFLLFKKEPASP